MINKIIENFLFVIYVLKAGFKKIICNIQGIPAFLKDLRELNKQLIHQKDFKITKLYPRLCDRFKQAGGITKHYFHQDLLVAQMLYKSKPRKHVDIGSRIDGFVAHVATFREIEVFDIRPMNCDIPNVRFKQVDVTGQIYNLHDYSDSISSLHAIEHFGLGRYGDTVDANGHLKALENIYKILQPHVKFYFSVPIGKQRIEFNSHRIFSMKYLFEIFKYKYKIESFAYVDDNNGLISDVGLSPLDIESSFNLSYGCGIFELTKL
jgi:hypothetical protein